MAPLLLLDDEDEDEFEEVVDGVNAATAADNALDDAPAAADLLRKAMVKDDMVLAQISGKRIKPTEPLDK